MTSGQGQGGSYIERLAITVAGLLLSAVVGWVGIQVSDTGAKATELGVKVEGLLSEVSRIRTRIDSAYSADNAGRDLQLRDARIDSLRTEITSLRDELRQMREDLRDIQRGRWGVSPLPPPTLQAKPQVGIEQ